jgi:hypothetical protein
VLCFILFHSGKEAAWLHTTLQDMGHAQAPTPIQADNTCATGIVTGAVKQHCSKAIKMSLYWIREQVAQGKFTVHCCRGFENLADSFTKHHSPAQH